MMDCAQRELTVNTNACSRTLMLPDITQFSLGNSGPVGYPHACVEERRKCLAVWGMRTGHTKA